MIRADLGDDWIMGSEGDDYIDGGDGLDVVDYSNSPRSDGFLYDGVDVDVSSSILSADPPVVDQRVGDRRAVVAGRGRRAFSACGRGRSGVDGTCTIGRSRGTGRLAIGPAHRTVATAPRGISPQDRNA